MITILGNADLLRHPLNFTEHSGGALFRDKDTHGLVGLHPPTASTPMWSARKHTNYHYTKRSTELC